MRQTVKTATCILSLLRSFHQSLLAGEHFFLLILPGFARAIILGYFGLHFNQPLRNDIPGSFGKNRIIHLAFADLLSNQATAIEEERCQAYAEEHPEH